MNGLYKYLSPFAPDYSGAVSVLFELGGLIVVCDAGGCVGNICGYDEPRWYNSKSALFSAGLRDLDTIFGGDDILLDKIEDAASQIDCKFIAFVGTPVPTVIGTDFKALCRQAQHRFNMPVIAVDTNGIDSYDKGQEKAYMSLVHAFAADKVPEINIIGATPLDMPAWENIAGYGMEAEGCNVVVSPSGLKAARYLRECFGTPYKAEYLEINKAPISNAKDSILIIHQQIAANEMRKYLRENKLGSNIDVATWFMLDSEFSENGDISLREEDDLAELLAKKNYDVIIGDPMFKRAIQSWQGEYIDFPHYAVSGSLYRDKMNYFYERF